VIGGITCAEIQEALQHVAESVEDDGYQVSLSLTPIDQLATSPRPSHNTTLCIARVQVLIGSTSLYTGNGVLSHLFA
jgi:hypothetical protein